MTGKVLNVKRTKSIEKDFNYLYEADDISSGYAVNPKILVISIMDFGRCIMELKLYGVFDERKIEEKVKELLETYRGEDTYLNTQAPRLKI